MKEGPVVTDVPRPVCVKRGDSACPVSLTHFFGGRALRQIFCLAAQRCCGLIGLPFFAPSGARMTSS
jgi:hypothetical protein